MIPTRFLWHFGWVDLCDHPKCGPPGGVILLRFLVLCSFCVQFVYGLCSFCGHCFHYVFIVYSLCVLLCSFCVWLEFIACLLFSSSDYYVSIMHSLGVSFCVLLPNIPRCQWNFQHHFASRTWLLFLLLLSFSTVVLIIAFSQYSKNIQIPCFTFKKGEGCHKMGFPLFRLFPVSNGRSMLNSRWVMADQC